MVQRKLETYKNIEKDKVYQPGKWEQWNWELICSIYVEEVNQLLWEKLQTKIEH